MVDSSHKPCNSNPSRLALLGRKQVGISFLFFSVPTYVRFFLNKISINFTEKNQLSAVTLRLLPKPVQGVKWFVVVLSRLVRKVHFKLSSASKANQHFIYCCWLANAIENLAMKVLTILLLVTGSVLPSGLSNLQEVQQIASRPAWYSHGSSWKQR